jgi:hypothetical protein
MTQMLDVVEGNRSLTDISSYIANILAEKLGYNKYKTETTLGC